MDHKVLPMAPLPQTQVLSSTSFVPPPLDGSLTLPEFYDWHLVHSPSHPHLVYVDAKGNEITISWEQSVRAVYRIANEIRRRLGKEPNAKNKPPTVVAILSSSG